MSVINNVGGHLALLLVMGYAQPPKSATSKCAKYVRAKKSRMCVGKNKNTLGWAGWIFFFRQCRMSRRSLS